MFDVLTLYSRPYDPLLPVVCLDEKSVSLHEDVRQGYRNSQKIRITDYEYKRKGTANLFVITEPKGSKHFVRTTERRTKTDFAKCLKWIEKKFRNAVTIHLVLDNLNTHHEKSLIETYGEKEGRRLWARFTVHYTPVHGSWLNQAEIAIGQVTSATLQENIPDIETLRKKTTAFAASLRKNKWTINWGFTVKKAKEWIVRREKHSA